MPAWSVDIATLEPTQPIPIMPIEMRCTMSFIYSKTNECLIYIIVLIQKLILMYLWPNINSLLLLSFYDDVNLGTIGSNIKYW